MTTADVSFDKLIDVVESHASLYEAALIGLEEAASSSTASDGQSNPQSVDITSATVATTKVQLTQSLTEMASGIAKNAADHTKGLGRKIGG